MFVRWFFFLILGKSKDLLACYNKHHNVTAVLKNKILVYEIVGFLKASLNNWQMSHDS